MLPSAQCVPRAKSGGKGCKGKQQQQQQIFFVIISAEISAKDVLCPRALDGHTDPPPPCLCPGSSRLVRPVNIRIPQHITQGGGRVQGQHSWESSAATALVMVRHFQPKTGEAVPVPQGLSSSRDLAGGQEQLLGAEGQPGAPGWAGRVWLWARFSKKTESYPEVIFLPMDGAQQAPVCQEKPSTGTR